MAAVGTRVLVLCEQGAVEASHRIGNVGLGDTQRCEELLAAGSP